MHNTEPRARVDRRSVAVFYVLACALSWPFYWWRDVHPESWARWGLLSWVIGEATEVGKSLLIAVTLHVWFDIAGTFPGPRTYTALALSIVFWIFLLLRWGGDGARGRGAGRLKQGGSGGEP